MALYNRRNRIGPYDDSDIPDTTMFFGRNDLVNGGVSASNVDALMNKYLQLTAGSGNPGGIPYMPAMSQMERQNYIGQNMPPMAQPMMSPGPQQMPGSYNPGVMRNLQTMQQRPGNLKKRKYNLGWK